MREKDFQNLLESIKQAGEYMKGKHKPSRVFRFTPAKVRKIRQQMVEEKTLHKTQENTGKKIKKRLKSISKLKRLDCVATDKCKINFEQEMKTHDPLPN